MLVSKAVGDYKRAPGLSPQTRLYASSIGGASTQMLWEVLQENGMTLNAVEDASNFVGVRLGLRVYLHRTLQSQLLQDGLASPSMLEDFLSWELGL